MLSKLFSFYFENYKKILVIPFIILLFNLGVIAYTYFTTGSVVYMDSSLKGGVSFTFTYEEEIDTGELTNQLISGLGTDDVDIVILRSQLTSSIIGYDVQTEEGFNQEDVQIIVESFIGEELEIDDISFGTQSSVIGESFISDALVLLMIGFILMSVVSYLYFKNIIPAITITFSTFSDFIGVIAVFDLFQIKISIATIGALLMIIGYSTDSDILLATNILKRTEGSLKERMFKAVKTQLTMALAAIATFGIMYLLSSVEVIKHIALVLLVGLLFDLMNTFFQNASLQRIYLERKK